MVLYISRQFLKGEAWGKIVIVGLQGEIRTSWKIVRRVCTDVRDRDVVWYAGIEQEACVVRPRVEVPE